MRAEPISWYLCLIEGSPTRGDSLLALPWSCAPMTDLRDPDPLVVVRSAEAPSRGQTLVARALAPIRRVTRQDLARTDRRQIEAEQDAVAPKTSKGPLGLIIWSLIIVVLVPMVFSGIYLFAFSSDQYVAETRFAVRQASGDLDESRGGNAVGGGSVVTGTMNLGGEDAEIVENYIHSRGIVDDISRTIDIRAIFQRPEADFLARLPANSSQEKFVDYWNKMVSVYLESSSGIVTVAATAFRREDALALTSAILASSERLANNMSMKIRRDSSDAAEQEVRRAEGQVRFALADLTSFRNSQHLIDPVRSSESTAKLLQQLMVDKIDVETKLYISQKTQGPDAPGLASVKAKLDSINEHILEQREQLAGDKLGSKNMAGTIAMFEELELKRLFAERMYGFARDGVERARIAAARQMIYLAVFVPPSLPQDFSYPLRGTDFVLISLAGLMCWICGATITASIIDHRL